MAENPCKADKRKLCKDTKEKVRDCLKQHKAELSAGCQALLDKPKDGKKKKEGKKKKKDGAAKPPAAAAPTETPATEPVPGAENAPE